MVGSVPVDNRPCSSSYGRSDILAKAPGGVTALWEPAPLALQVPDRHGDAVPRGHAQQHVDVVRHCLTLHQLDILLTAQIPQDLPDLTPKPSVEDLTAVLRYNHDVVLAIPPLHGTGSAIRA